VRLSLFVELPVFVDVPTGKERPDAQNGLGAEQSPPGDTSAAQLLSTPIAGIVLCDIEHPRCARLSL
jgi:hypothetical protein